MDFIEAKVKASCSIVVLNFEGLEELKRCLPSVHAACEFDGEIHERILLDNHSNDGSPEWVERNFPKFRVIRRPNNLVAHAFNEIAKDLKHDFCIFLNNDFKIPPDFIQKLLCHFKDPEVAAVSPLWVPCHPEEEEIPSLTHVPRYVHRLELREGFLEMVRVSCQPSEARSYYTFHASSYSAYRREKFIELGGYNFLLFPLSWIDVDFPYVLWKAGYKVAHERETFILDGPPGNTTNRVFGHKRALMIYERNRLLTTWLNLTDRQLILKSISWGLRKMIKALLGLHPTLVMPYLLCLFKLPAIMRVRRTRRKLFRLTDQETLEKIQRLCV